MLASVTSYQSYTTQIHVYLATKSNSCANSTSKSSHTIVLRSTDIITMGARRVFLQQNERLQLKKSTEIWWSDDTNAIQDIQSGSRGKLWDDAVCLWLLVLTWQPKSM